jgi:molybdopterin-guanine dinucleotide biosynthesis protein B
MKFFSIAGWSDSGKTTLITRLTEKFKSKNKRVAAVKNIPHKYHLQPETKDSFKFLSSGCDEVFLVAQNEIISMRRKDTEKKIFEILESQRVPFDYILLEGLFRDDIPVIEVFDSRKHNEAKMSLQNLCAIVTNKEKMNGIDIPLFEFDDIDGVAKFMEDYHG